MLSARCRLGPLEQPFRPAIPIAPAGKTGLAAVTTHDQRSSARAFTNSAWVDSPPRDRSLPPVLTMERAGCARFDLAVADAITSVNTPHTDSAPRSHRTMGRKS
jgi:hypothetical protein